MEFVIGPVVALLFGMKFTDFKSKQQEAKAKALEQRIEVLETRLTANETEMPKQMLATIVPVAKAVQQLNRQVGI